MNITFLNMPIEFYSPVSGGAVATIIMEVSRALQAEGHRVTILSRTATDAQYPVGDILPLAVDSPEGLSYFGRRLTSLQRRLHRYDWFEYVSYRASFEKVLRNLSPAPDVVIVFNDLVSPKYIRRILPKARIYSWLQNECRTNQRDLAPVSAATTAFFTCSSYIRDWTSSIHHIPLEKFAVLTSGIDLARFFPRDNHALPVPTLRTLFIGRIDPNKGPDLALDAVSALRREGLDLSISIAGGLWFYSRGNEMDDPFFRSLHEKITAASGYARHLGHVTREKVPDLIRQHDVAFVLSRSNEPFGLVVLEAMASGLAVIASNRGGLPEACGEAAQLVNPDQPDEIASALRKLAIDPAFLAAQKQKSLVRAHSVPWSTVSTRMIENFKRSA
jgi:glycosyltransferase involved in cell wall biosynthesis